ncbi:MAG: VCBS repeat-containing protein [Planctomycetes bacterium]|nr:VCBS repeat-containing protein [Planctomycetota bacterium]
MSYASARLVLAIAFAPLLAPLPSLASAQSPPTLSIELRPGSETRVGGELVLDLRVDDPDGDRLDVDLVRGPTRVRFAPIRGARPPFHRTVRWQPYESDGGLARITFEARESAVPTSAACATREWPIFGDSTITLSGSASQLVDLDRDGRLDVAVPVPTLDRAGLEDVGAIALFSFHGPGAPQPWTRRLLVAATPLAGAQLGHGGSACQELEAIDLDGDGYDDLIASSREGGFSLHFWPGPATASNPLVATARMHAPTCTTRSAESQSLLFGDVTGDGFVDVVVVAPTDSGGGVEAGALHVFDGGPGRFSGVRTPTASLRLASPSPHDRLGGSEDPIFSWEAGKTHCVQLRDVTGDGVADVIAAAPRADVGGSVDAGAIAIFAGGPALSGNVTPTALLHRPVPRADERLGLLFQAAAARIADLTGDGIDDLLVAAPDAKPHGELLLFEGGPALVGTPAPRAKLLPNGPLAERRQRVSSRRIVLCDLDHDGIVDLLALTPRAAVNGRVEAGAISCWRGGPGLVGAVAPSAELIDAAPRAGARLGANAEERGIGFADLTGDGQLDVVTLTEQENDDGTVIAMAHVWAGGATWSGAIGSTARLVAARAIDRRFAGGGLAIADLTGDGVEDLLLATNDFGRPGLPPSSFVECFAGGPTMVGAPPATAQLAVDRAPGRESWLLVRDCIDVTGDGIADVVGQTIDEFELGIGSGGGYEHGETIVVFAGGAWSGRVTPIATHRVERRDDVAGSIEYGDLDGDGALELVLPQPFAELGGFARVGKALVLAGGARLHGEVAPLAVLEPPTRSRGLGAFLRRLSDPVTLADLDGDGRLDLLAPLPGATVNGKIDAGSVTWYAQPAIGPFAASVSLLPPVSERGGAFGR